MGLPTLFLFDRFLDSGLIWYDARHFKRVQEGAKMGIFIDCRMYIKLATLRVRPILYQSMN